VGVKIVVMGSDLSIGKVFAMIWVTIGLWL
jgi:hypothetical protein